MLPISALIQRAGAKLGVSIQRIDNTLERARMRTFTRLGTSMVLDVGANRGQYGHHVRASGFRGAIHSFEPIPAAFAQLQEAARADGQWTCKQVALGTRAEERTFFVSENLVSSSLLAVTDVSTRAHGPSRKDREIQVQVSTLDAEFPGSGQGGVHLKLDTQGSELDVLRGASETLSRIHSLECELSLVRLYDGQPLFFEVAEFLDAAGFSAVWLERGFQSPSRELLQVDALFVRERTP